jgi:hypothetical protein
MQHSAELVEVIRRIRNRWRLRLAARGAVIVFVGTVLALLVSARGLEPLTFSAPSIVGFRLLALAVFGARLLRHQASAPMVTDTQVAPLPRRAQPVVSRHPERGRNLLSGPDASHSCASLKSWSSRPSNRAAPSNTAWRSTADGCAVTSRRLRRLPPSPRC